MLLHTADPLHLLKEAAGLNETLTRPYIHRDILSKGTWLKFTPTETKADITRLSLPACIAPFISS